MANYLAPGIYAESINKANAPIESVSASTGGFVGIAVRGVLNVPTLVTSWQSFLDNFAHGMETPFLANSDLAYAVYGFFQNGGTKCYIIRTASAKAAKASGKIDTTTVFTAKDEGTWGNKLKVSITVNADVATNFDLTIKLNDDVVEQFTNVSIDTDSNRYYVDILEESKFIACASLAGALSVTATDIVFTGGADGIDDIADKDYKTALSLFDTVDVNLICVPGQVSNQMVKDVLSYAEERGNVFAIVDGAKSATADEIKTLRKDISCKNGALYYPWIKVTDPLSKTGKLRDCPACGHIMGVYSRTIQERGVWKAPAGTEASVRGAVDLVKTLVKAELDSLNPAGVNAIVAKPNYGIVVWGARSLSPVEGMKYVSDVLLNVNIKESISNGTQWAVFEPNNSVLWTKVQATIEAYLDSLWREGGLVGATAPEAYFVKCDESLNTESVRNAGKLICDVGYAPTKPAEFIVFRISHSIS